MHICKLMPKIVILTGEHCVSLCNTTDEEFHQELGICRKSFSYECNTLNFQGVLGHFVSTNKCFPSTELLNCRFAATLSDGSIPLDGLYSVAFCMTWLLAMFAMVGNMVTICNSASVLFKQVGNMPKVKKLYNVLLLNLGSADLLMGVFLLTHMILFSTLGNPFVSPDYQIWKSGYGCAILGMTSFLSSQVSVTTLVIITSCRLYSVLWPYKVIRVKPIAAACMLSWILWTAVACIPVLGNEDTFHNSMFVDDECSGFMLTATYSQWTNVLKQMMEKINCTETLPKTRSWGTLKSFLNDIQMFNRSMLKTYGYYSDTNFCAPNYFDLNGNPSLGFLMLIIVFNLLAFSYMACAYFCIFRRTSKLELDCSAVKCVSSNNNRRELENKSMYRRIFFIILTDFACWVPISLIVIAKAIYDSGVSNYIVFYTIGFLMPLNSALNPFLYTNLWKKLWNRMRNSVTKDKTEQDSSQYASGANSNKTSNIRTSNAL